MLRGSAALIGMVALVTVAVPTAPAGADGLPVGSLDVGASGIAAPASPFRYVALRAGTGTLIARTARQGGQVMFSRRIPGHFTIPAVAYDGSAGGLSADGRTLVLIRPRPAFPRRHTALAIVDTPRLQAHVVHLGGDFSFDAVSPNGRWAYLIHYLSPRNPTDYEVRAYDTRKLRLSPGPIVDPSEPDEKMGGNPLSRAMSPDGRWAYTLYDGGGEPFVHALDTVRRTAVCVDLPRPLGRRLVAVAAASTGLSVDGGRLVVSVDAAPIALIDTRTFRVSRPVGPAASDAAGEGEFPWAELGLAALAAAAVVWLAVRLNRPPRPGERPAVSPKPE